MGMKASAIKWAGRGLITASGQWHLLPAWEIGTRAAEGVYNGLKDDNKDDKDQ